MTENLYRSGKITQLPAEQVERIRRKLNHLYQLLIARFGRTAIHSMMSGLAFVGLMGFGPKSHAQSIPNFAPPVNNPFNLSLIPSGDWVHPDVVDIDGDGDMDIMGGSGDRIIYLYQNNGTLSNPDFAAPIPSPYGFDTSYTSFAVDFADWDADGDFDCFAGGIYGQVDYYENTGQANNPVFSNLVTAPFGIDSILGLITIPQIGDLDGDGDLDILYGEGFEDWVYLENIGTSTNPNFAPQVLNPFNLPAFPATYGYFSLGDLDLDGDLDIMAATDTGSFAYIENIGTINAASFASPVLNPFGIQPQGYLQIFDMADLDGDGDLDLLTYQYDIDAWEYYENNSTVNINEGIESAFSVEVFPNPAHDQLTVQWETPKDPGVLSLKDLLGRALITQEVRPQHPGMAQMNLGSLAPGPYILDLRIGEKSIQKRVIKE